MAGKRDHSCVDFLRWALPRMGLRWLGFRRPRRQVCRRVRHRFRGLGLAHWAAYRAYLESHPDEWRELDALCRVTISRFNRNRRVFEQLGDLLRALEKDAGPRSLRAWSAGCASGEEPFSVVLAADRAGLERPIEVVGTDRDPAVLERARRGEFTRGSIRELSASLLAEAFETVGDSYVLRRDIVERVRFMRQDLRRQSPPGRFDLILCRNMAFTYFDETTQQAVCQRFAAQAAPGAALVVGAHETLPPDVPFEPWPERPMVHRFDATDD